MIKVKSEEITVTAPDLGIESGLTFNTEDLHIVCSNGSINMVKFLVLLLGMNPSVDEDKPLKLAVENNHYEIVKFLLRDDRVNPTSNNNHTLYKAIEDNRLDIVKILLGIDDNNDKMKEYSNRSVDPLSPLTIVSKGKEVPIAVYGDLDGTELDSPFNVSDMKGVVEVVVEDTKNTGDSYISNKCLRKVDPSANYNKAICLAAEKGHNDIVRVLLGDSKVDPSDRSNYVISTYIKRKDMSMVSLLLDHPMIDLSSEDNQAIFIAVEYGCYDIVKLILESRRIDLSSDVEALLRIAQSKQYLEIERLLRILE